MSDRSVVAWIAHRAEDEFEGAFVAEAVDRQPATKIHASAESARRWIEREADAIAAAVRWLEAAPASIAHFPPAPPDRTAQAT